MNNVSLVGRLTKNVDLRKTNSGKDVASCTIAVQRDKETADFIPFVVWESNATYLAKYAEKGTRIALTGQLQSREYESNGKKQYVLEVVGRVEILFDKKDDARPQEETPKQSNNDISFEIDDSLLPF
jgi:single-strand DNA-binding protein